MAAEKYKEAYSQFFQKSSAERTIFLLTETKQDCCFVFEPTESNQPIRRLYSYKWMLSAVSPVFETMFTGDFKESTSSMDIKIDDISFEDFEMFLSCIYKRTWLADRWPKSFWDNLLNIVDKYMMKPMLVELRTFAVRYEDTITTFKWNKMQNQKKDVFYEERILLDRRLGEFDLITFVDFINTLKMYNTEYCKYYKLDSDTSYKLIKAYIKHKGYDVNSKDMVRVCDADLHGKKPMLKSHREIIESLLHYVRADITSFVKNSK